MPNTLEETEALIAANNILSQHDVEPGDAQVAEAAFDGILDDWMVDKVGRPTINTIAQNIRDYTMEGINERR